MSVLDKCLKNRPGEYLCMLGGIVKWCNHRMEVLKKLKIGALYDPAMPLLGRYPKELKTWTPRVICTPVFITSTTHTSHKVKAIQTPIKGWMGKQNVAYTYNGRIALKWKKILLTCYNMDECRYYAKWNKPITKRQRLYFKVIEKKVEEG